MPDRSDRARVHDMLNAVRRIARFVGDLEFDHFVENELLVSAVCYEFAIVGEAAGRVSSRLRSRHPTVPWREARAMRNVIVHGYHGVDLAIVWRAIIEDAPALRDGLRRVAAAEGWELEGERTS